MRKVEVYSGPVDGYGEVLEYEGIFHKWGTRACEVRDDEFIEITVAVVEKKDGVVKLVDPRRIKFNDEQYVL